jgi:hypothetical protein
MTATTTHPIRELDHRYSDGIDVRLLWNQRENRVFVTVNDAKTEEAFTIEVRDGERAMDVFQHPFAYAGRPGATLANAA